MRKKIKHNTSADSQINNQNGSEYDSKVWRLVKIPITNLIHFKNLLDKSRRKLNSVKWKNNGNSQGLFVN
jgi:hypothetical protein